MSEHHPFGHKKEQRPGILIAAVGSGNGKTTVTMALLETLKKQGLHPCAFKCGPDYIDPMFHQRVIGVPSHNLDSFFCDEGQIRALYERNTEPTGIAVVEGVMGLYDGITGTREEGSAYHVASILGLPIVLVVDAHGMGRSVLPLIAGFLKYDRNKLIQGVILNRASGNFYEMLAVVIERELAVPVLGFLPEKRELALESRHLGLKLPGEVENLKEQIRGAAELFGECVDVARVIELARGARCPNAAEMEMAGAGKPKVKIGVAKDEAFCFYYEENLRMLREAGAELVFFSPLHDSVLPEGIAGLVLGGGYPELYAAELEKNASMRDEVKAAIGGGMPSVAECGGFMFLHETLKDDKGAVYAMCGALSGMCFYTGRLVRFGYVALSERTPIFLNGKPIKGHEFHYYDSENNGADCTLKKPFADRQWEGVHVTERSFWGFPHLYYPSNPEFVTRFIDRAESFERGENFE